MPIFIDAHVHIHPDFSLKRFFSAALDNFSAAATKQGVHGNSTYVLALTEGMDCDVFSRLQQQAISPEDVSARQSESDSLVFHKTAEDNSLIVQKGSQNIFLIAGRQLISKDNIELLSLFNPLKIKDRTRNLTELAQTVTDNGGLAVVPWGVGKWLGTRGKVVESLLTSALEYPLSFGDNGNRPLLWPEPSLLKQAREAGVILLSGSDPLPLASHVERPASSGTFIHHENLSFQHPATSLKEILTTAMADNLALEPFGCRIGSFQFLRDQLWINLRKRMSRITSTS